AFALAQELTRKDSSPAIQVQNLLETVWKLGDKDGYAQAFVLAPELVRKATYPDSAARDLLETLWKLGDKDGYAQAFVLAPELVRKATYPDSAARDLLETLWKLGDKDGYAQAFALAQELTRKDSAPGISARYLLKTVLRLGDQDGGRRIQAWAEQLAQGSDYALGELRKCLNETKRGEVAFASVAFGCTEYGSVVAASVSFGTERFGAKPLGRAARYTALDKHVDRLVKVRDWAGLASLDFAGQNVGDTEVGWLEQKRFQALAEAGELARIASYVQQKKRALDDPAKKNDWELISGIEFAFHVGDAALARRLIGRLEKKDENDYPDRILVAQLEKATWDGDLAAAERFLVSIKDATYRSSAASTLAKAYSRKGDRAAVERLIASFPEPEKQVSLMMSAAWIFD
ncbi:MAG: hypothetical protein KA118_14595, partial [Verrucomicrobia bacterium]|nr:hypothetical protein [Verrucomicrobiota bacterium]